MRFSIFEGVLTGSTGARGSIGGVDMKGREGTRRIKVTRIKCSLTMNRKGYINEWENRMMKNISSIHSPH